MWTEIPFSSSNLTQIEQSCEGEGHGAFYQGQQPCSWKRPQSLAKEPNSTEYEIFRERLDAWHHMGVS